MAHIFAPELAFGLGNSGSLQFDGIGAGYPTGAHWL